MGGGVVGGKLKCSFEGELPRKAECQPRVGPSIRSTRRLQKMLQKTSLGILSFSCFID